MKNLKTFIIGALCGAMIMSAPALANGVKQLIEAELNTINITVNGTPVEGENILYNDRTYVPLRLIAEMLGKTVTWDGDTNTAGINDIAGVEFSGEVVGNVAGKDILQSQLDMYVSNAKAENADLTDEELIVKAKENIAYDEAVVLLANEMGIQLDAEFYENYNAYIDEMNAQYSAQTGSDNAFEQLLNAIGYTKESYQRIQEIEYLKSKIIEKNNELYAPKGDDISNFYNEHKEEFKYDGLTAKHILFSTQNEDGSEMTTSQIKAVEKKANEVYNKIVKGGDFDALMNEHSEDPGLATNPNGYVFTRGDMVTEFEDAAYALEVGEVSKPVKSAYGYHIIKLVEKIDYFDITNTAVSEYINLQIKNQKLDNDVKAKLSSLNVSWN